MTMAGQGAPLQRTSITMWTCLLYFLWYILPEGSGILIPQFNPDIWLPMDSGTITHLILGPHMDGILAGNPNLVPGVLQSGVKLNVDNANQVVKFGDVEETCLTDPTNCTGLTLMLWIKLGEPRTDFVTYLSSEGQTNEPTGVSLFQKDGNLVATLATKEKRWNVTVDAGNFTDRWTHIAMGWKPSWGLDLTVDGVLLHFDAYGNEDIRNPTAYGQLVLGTNLSGLEEYETCGSAVFDNLLVWYKFLSDTAIAGIYGEDHNLIASTSQALVAGVPFNILLEDQDVMTCVTLEASDSRKRSTMVELKGGSSESMTGYSEIKVELVGSYNIDSLQVYSTGGSQDQCTQLTECLIDVFASSPDHHWSVAYNCYCPNKDCARIFLDNAKAQTGCDVNWTYCQPIKVCLAIVSGIQDRGKGPLWD